MKRGHSYINLKSYQNYNMDEDVTSSDIFKRPYLNTTMATDCGIGDDDGYCSVRQVFSRNDYGHHNNINTTTNDEATSDDLLKMMDDSVIEELYRASYRPARLPKFIAFDHIDANNCEDGISKRAALFRDMDFANYPHRLERFNGKLRKATINDYCHVLDYLMSDVFDRNIFKTTKYDHILNAIVSFLLEWDNESLQQLHKKYRINWSLIESLQNARTLDNGAYIYLFYGRPVCKFALKILKTYFDDDTEAAATTIPIDRNLLRIFIWSNYIDPRMIEHFRWLERHIESGQAITENIRDELMQHMAIPYKLENLNIDLESIRSIGPLKFISGVACSGKTTILNKLRQQNWKVFSRGDIGSFGGKANSAPTIGTLHAALEYVLTQSDVIGDRGPIDNPLWTIIMELCDPNCSGSLVTRILQFFNSHFNEPSIAYFIKHRGVIFIDTNFKANAARMMSRNTHGDAHRSRLQSYAKTQFMAYYIAVRLFGWLPQCVPYEDVSVNDDSDDGATTIITYAPQYYTEICQKLHVYFTSNQSGETSKPKPSHLPYIRFPKPSNEYISDMTFPKAVGIFK